MTMVATDNPRLMQPDAIAAALVNSLAAERAESLVELDCARAIAVDWADAGDVALVAGKGRETVQVIGWAAVSLDDRTCVRATLAGQCHRVPADGGVA
jgi:UDP-N-acetylmuramoyl-L-alanyl-D-glutamate--2,6-diaminopimelate ligase